MAKQRDMAAVADQLKQEIDGDAEHLGRELFGGVPDDAIEMSKREYHEFVGRNWQDPGFRQALLTRIGPDEFLKVAHAVAPPPDLFAHAANVAQMGGFTAPMATSAPAAPVGPQVVPAEGAPNG
jgi:hypothetical protein